MPYQFINLTPTAFRRDPAIIPPTPLASLVGESITNDPGIIPVRVSEEDQLIIGTMDLSGSTPTSDKSEFKNHNDDLIQLMRNPQQALSNNIYSDGRKIEEITKGNILLFFNYEKGSSEIHNVNVFLNTSVSVIRSPVLDNPLSSFHTNLVSNHATRVNTVMPKMITNENTIFVHEQDNKAFCHIFLSKDDAELEQYHYAIIRNPMILEDIMNNNNLFKRFITQDGNGTFIDGSRTGQAQSLVFKIDDDLKIFYQSGVKLKNEDGVPRYVDCTCGHILGEIHSIPDSNGTLTHIYKIKDVYIPLWVCK